jgi:hypothetical protein
MVYRSVRLFLASVICAVTALVGAPAASADDALNQLALKYAPVVVVRHQSTPCGDGEPYLPVPVETVLGNSTVTLHGPNGEIIKAPKAADLTGKGDGWYLDLPGNPLDPGCDYETWFDQASAGRQPTLYARLASDLDHPNQVALQYWFFWTYNDWNDKHEGDWEMVQILFPASSAAQALTVSPTSTAYAQHEGSETSAWNDPKLHKDGNHIAVYPGQGSHAAYYTQANWFGKSAAAGFGCDNTTSPGDVVRPAIVVMPSDPAGDFAWLSYTGRWGEKAPSFNNGPTGPNTKTQWEHPISWQVDQGRDTAVALPQVTGPAISTFCSATAWGSELFIKALDNPTPVVVGILAVLGFIGWLISRTDWRHADSAHPDRERRAGQMATAAFGFLRRHPLALVWPILLALVTAVVALLAQRFFIQPNQNGDLGHLDALAHPVLGIGLSMLVSIALLPFTAAALTSTVRLVNDVARGERPHGLAAIRESFAKPSGLWVLICGYLAIMLLAGTVIGLPIALWLLARWAVSMPAAVIEDRGVRASFGRSVDLTKGRRLRSLAVAFGFYVLAFALPDLIGAVLVLLTNWPFVVTTLVTLVLKAILFPVSAVGLATLFYDLRRRQPAVAPTEVSVND